MQRHEKQYERAYSYQRFSSKPQEKGDSLRRQGDTAIRIAKELNVPLVNAPILDDGRSAYKGDQQKLRQFIAAIKAKKIPPNSLLIVEKFDRLTREELRPASNLIAEILENGVDIATERRVFTKASLNELVTVIEITMELWLAHEESKKKTMRLWRVGPTVEQSTLMGSLLITTTTLQHSVMVAQAIGLAISHLVPVTQLFSLTVSQVLALRQESLSLATV